MAKTNKGKCRYCGKIFFRQRSTKKFCSSSCRYTKFRKKKQFKRTHLYCLNCGTILEGYKLKYCSDRCSDTYRERLYSNHGFSVSDCCEAKMKSTKDGFICKTCKNKCRPSALFFLKENL